MQLEDFNYDLPRELIAQYPLPRRSASRLLCLNRRDNSRQHRYFYELPNLLDANDLLVFNDTRVIPAKIFAKKITGGKVKVLVERIINEKRFTAHLKANRHLQKNMDLVLADDDTWATIIDKEDDLYVLELRCEVAIFELLEKIGRVPLPPYISRCAEASDRERYQTIFAQVKGAVAAPTAGLHFDAKLMLDIAKKGVQMVFVTLHVGAGTFQPVRVNFINEHKMHKEMVFVSQETCEKIFAAKKIGGKIIAIGTTVARSLETAAKSGVLKPFYGETDIFIYPGYEFRCIDALLTNFHLPKSTLLMLVAAFAGYDFIRDVYKEAILERYRFFSYGDAMIVL